MMTLRATTPAGTTVDPTTNRDSRGPGPAKGDEEPEGSRRHLDSQQRAGRAEAARRSSGREPSQHIPLTPPQETKTPTRPGSVPTVRTRKTTWTAW